MFRKVIDHDPLSGISHVFYSEDGIATITAEQDVAPITDFNRAQFNDSDKRFGDKNIFHKVASIPLTVWRDLEKKGITRDQAAMKRWLNDADNRVFKTKNVTV